MVRHLSCLPSQRVFPLGPWDLVGVVCCASQSCSEDVKDFSNKLWNVPTATQSFAKIQGIKNITTPTQELQTTKTCHLKDYCIKNKQWMGTQVLTSLKRNKYKLLVRFTSIGSELYFPSCNVPIKVTNLLWCWHNEWNQKHINRLMRSNETVAVLSGSLMVKKVSNVVILTLCMSTNTNCGTLIITLFVCVGLCEYLFEHVVTHLHAWAQICFQLIYLTLSWCHDNNRRLNMKKDIWTLVYITDKKQYLKWKTTAGYEQIYPDTQAGKLLLNTRFFALSACTLCLGCMGL